ncbi:MAG: hypothetical protein HFH68_01735 [Lachnospiraceae bacterium]|nr:hypothetical protein [Lachnospiraceae bacterium]
MLKKCSYNNRNSIAFLIDTPTQLFNSIEYVLGHNLYGVADAYIQVKFSNADELIHRVTKKKIFKNIYLLKPDKNGKLKHLGIINALFFPRFYIKIVHNIDVYSKHYQKIFIAFATKTFDFLIASSGCKNIIGFDDGIGSYLGDPFSDNYKKRYMYFRKITGHGYFVDKVYLNNPERYRGISERKVFPICDKLDSAGKNLIYEVFNYRDSDLYRNYNVVYLNQPITHIPDYYLKEKEIVNILGKKLKEKIIIRFHPNEKNKKLYPGFQTDNENNMWELLCKEQIDSNFLLVGYFSTAQFLPKFIADTEPFIIFTFKLYTGIKDNICKNYCDLVEAVKNSYESSGKIFIPETFEEYCYDIEEICSKI